MIDPVTGWFEVIRYDYKIAITIANLGETAWLSRYPRPIEITYDQGKEFIGHKFRKYLIETEYGINTKPTTLGNTMSNAILEWIHHVLGNLVRTFKIQQPCVEKNDPWTGILDAAAFAILSITNRKNVYSPSQMIFDRDMIILIKHRMDWELIRQQK